MVYQTFALWITEYDKAAKILVDKESNIRLAKLDATVHMDAAKEHQVNTFGTDVIIFFFGGGSASFCLPLLLIRPPFSNYSFIVDYTK
jgi:hypothetical protein